MVKATHRRLPMSPLDRKLLRDLWRMKGQATAVGMVIALGVLMLVMDQGLVNSLEETKRAYYERYRLAEVFAPLKRAPQHLLRDLSEVPGVAMAEGRVSGAALINLPQNPVPVRAQAVSLPDFGPPNLNDVYLAEGRRIDPSHEDEILLLEGFARAHGLRPGDELSATMNGARRTFRIAGLAQSPEFLYSAPPGEMMPDDARFAVIWMSETALAAAYDLEGAFNEALLGLSRSAALPAVLDAVDRLLAPYGGAGAYGLSDHVSNRFIEEEINGLRVTSRVVPPVFLAVAAFLLNIVISRMIQAEREQIGLLKAYGYSSGEVGGHYVRFILVVAIGGAVAGCLLGILAGRALTGVYQIYYKFPFLVFQLDPASFIIAFSASVLAASAGGIFVLRKVFDLTPAEAMRPPTPPDYSRAARLGKTLATRLDQPSRMVLRRLLRQPGRAATAILSIAAGMGLSVAMLGVMGGFDEAVDLNFSVVDRSDVNVSFVEPLSDQAIRELQRMKGVMSVEPYRNVPAVLRNGHRSYRGTLNGLVAEPRLFRVVDVDMREIPPREDGIILARPLAEILDVRLGESVTVEIREGRRPTLRVPVTGIAETLLGSPAYLEMNALNRELKEPFRVGGAFLRIDQAEAGTLYRTLKDMPAVAGVTLKRDALVAIRRMLDTGAGAMRYIMTTIAGIITFGVIYNSARIAFAERARDLASLRAIGFTRGEASFVLLGELAIITLLALPVGAVFGYYLSQAIAAGFSTDLYQIPATIGPRSFGNAALAVLAAAAISGWLVKRDIDRIDIVATLKTRE